MVTKATAPFQQIKTLVRQNVESGDWRPGDRIPSELDLAAQFADEWDQTAFDPDYDTLPLEHFEPLVRERFATGKLI